MKTTHLIFDFNGTCFKDTLINYKAWSNSVRNWLNRDFSMKEYQSYNGRTGYNTIEELFKGSGKTKEEYLNLLEEQNNMYLKVCRESAPLNLAPGLKELVESAKKSNITVAICTSATPALMLVFRDLLPAVDKLFEEKNIITSDGTLPSKPNPAIFKYAVEKLGAQAQNCIAFEDTRSGLKSAYDSGIKRVVAITGDNIAPLETDVPLFLNCKDFFPVIEYLKKEKVFC